MQMRWIAAAGARAAEPDRVKGDDCHNARGAIAAATRCSSDDCRRGRSCATKLAPDRSWVLETRVATRPSRVRRHCPRGEGGGRWGRHIVGHAEPHNVLAGSGAVLECDARRIGVAPQCPGRSAAGDRTTHSRRYPWRLHPNAGGHHDEHTDHLPEQAKRYGTQPRSMRSDSTRANRPHCAGWPRR